MNANNTKKNVKTTPTTRTDPKIQACFDQIVIALNAVPDTYRKWKNGELAKARGYVKGESLESLDAVLTRVVTFQKELVALDAAAAEKDRLVREAEAAKLAAQAAADAARQVAEAAKKAVREPVVEAWAKALKASRNWVETQNEQGHKGQLAFEETFNRQFQAMAVRVSGVNYDDAEAVQTLVSDLQGLTTMVYQFKQNWCITCGKPIEFEMVIKGRTIKLTRCQGDAQAVKNARIAEKAANSGALTADAIYEIQANSENRGVTVQLKQGTIIGGSKPYELEGLEPESEPVVSVQKPRRRPAKAAQAAEEEGADQEGQIEKIGKKRSR